MKIFRYVPNSTDYRFFMGSKNYPYRWWPKGFDLGHFASSCYPLPPSDETWLYEKNHFSLSLQNRPLADFPAFPLSIPVVSEHGLAYLDGLSGLDIQIPLKIDNRDYIAIQPKILDFGVLDKNSSTFINCPSSDPLLADEPFLFIFRNFIESKIDVDIFWLKSLMPYSDVYITDKFMDAVRSAGLSGLEFVELVFDGGRPCRPQYPPNLNLQYKNFPRYALEEDLLRKRGDSLLCSIDAIEDIILKKINEGLLSPIDQRPDIIFQ